MFSSFLLLPKSYTSTSVISPYLKLDNLNCLNRVFVFFMLKVTGKIAMRSGKYFSNQQQTLGEMNGYIEEMINGQKVIKVFTYEEEAKKKFDEINARLCDHSRKANKYAAILMPVLNNLGNLEYVLVAVIGGMISIYGNGILSIGAIASFLQLTKQHIFPKGNICCL